jgi:hypothetical protein
LSAAVPFAFATIAVTLARLETGRRPERRPSLQVFSVARARFVDAVTPPGVTALRLPVSYPLERSYAACRAIGARAYDAGEPGVACRSAAEATRAHFVGEELAVFDSSRSRVIAGMRQPFTKWYPLPHLER